MTALKKITQSKYFKTTLGIVGCLIAGAVIFASGVYVGQHRAKYSYQWGANYERNFMGGGRMGEERNPGGFGQGGNDGPTGMMRNFQGQGFRNGHGLAGTIVSITDNNIIVKDPSGKENTVTVSDKTLIKDGQTDLKITDLKNEERIVIIGKPGESGMVNADLIRVFEMK